MDGIQFSDNQISETIAIEISGRNALNERCGVGRPSEFITECSLSELPANVVFALNPVSISATVSAPTGSSSSATPPTGSVSFYEGSNLLGTAIISGSTATYTTTSLSTGVHSITAQYQGDTNYSAAQSSSLSEVIANFTIAPPSGGSSSATTTSGGQAVYPLLFSPPTGQVFPSAINLTVSGLPAGATGTFSPSSIAAGSGATTVALTVQLAKTTAMLQISPQPMNGAPLPISLGLLLLPLAALRRRGVQLFRRNMWLILLAAVGAVTVAGLSSCGGHASNGSGGAAAPQTYTLTVTATSGTLSNSTALTLTVQ